MKKWKKRIAGMLSACFMVICMLGVSGIACFLHTNIVAQAETTENVVSGKCGKKATWEYNRDTKVLKISGTGKMDDFEYPWYDYRPEIEKVVIGDQITVIGQAAFYSCTALKQVHFGNSVKIVGHDAFSDCTALKSIKLDGKIREIGASAFSSCENLTNVYIGKNVNLVWWDVFYGCNSLVNIEIDERNKNIIAEGNEVKNAGMFGACGGRGSGSYGVKYVYNQKTKTLTISGTGEMLNGYEDEDIPKDYYYNFLSESPYKKLIKKEVEKIVIGNEITNIGDFAFADCKALKEVKLGKKVKKIGERAFDQCIALKKINWTENIEYIADCSFYSCKKLTKLYVGKSVKTIDDHAFLRCNNLKQIKVHKANKKFSKRENMLLNKKQTKLILGCFASDTTCHIYASVTSVNNDVITNKKIKNFKVSQKNKNYASKRGLLYSKDGKTLYLCPKGRKGTATIFSGATIISENAFNGCGNVTDIVFPTTVTTVEKHAFGRGRFLKSLDRKGDVVAWVPTGMKKFYKSLLNDTTGFGGIIKEVEE